MGITAGSDTKRDGWCIDNSKLNSVTKKDVNLLPFLEDCLNTFSGNILFSKSDANSACYHMNVAENDRAKTHLLQNMVCSSLQK